MRVFFYSIIVLCLYSCGQDKANKTLHHGKEVETSVQTEQSFPIESAIDILFLGHQIHCISKELPLEFARICREDNNLAYDSINQNITIYGTTFHLNIHGHGFALITSVQPDTKQIQKVREAISDFHGAENFVEDWHYSWLPFTDSTKIGKNYPVIHLRRVRSDEGGTVIIVN